MMGDQSSDEFNSFTTDWKNRIQSLIKLVVLLSGGAMSITIGIFVDESRSSLPQEAIGFIRLAWFALAMSLVSSVLMPFILVISGALVLKDWKRDLKSKSFDSNLFDAPLWVYVSGFILLGLAVLGCIVGLWLLAIGAAHAI